MSITDKIKDNAKVVTAIAVALTAVGGAVAMYLGPVQAGIKDAIAQEAEEAVDDAFEKKVAPLAIQFRRKIELDRRRDDRAERRLCMEYRVEFAAGEQRKRRCDAESDYRWARWEWEDCVDLKGEDHPTCIKPEAPPRVDSQRREP